MKTLNLLFAILFIWTSFTTIHSINTDNDVSSNTVIKYKDTNSTNDTNGTKIEGGTSDESTNNGAGATGGSTNTNGTNVEDDPSGSTNNGTGATGGSTNTNGTNVEDNPSGSTNNGTGATGGSTNTNGTNVEDDNGGSNVSTPPPVCRKCFRNINGLCGTIDVPCSSDNSVFQNNMRWDVAHFLDCAYRDHEEVKVCNLDCFNIYRKINCPFTLEPVCGYSLKLGKCKKFANGCSFKKDACSHPNIIDWRVARYSACQYLTIGGPAGPCV